MRGVARTAGFGGGCFAKLRATVSAGAWVVFGAVRRVAVWAVAARPGLPGPLSGPCDRYLVAVELQQVVGGGD